MATYSQQIFSIDKEIEESKQILESYYLELGESCINLGYCPNDNKCHRSYTDIFSIIEQLKDIEQRIGELKDAENSYDKLNENEKVLVDNLKKCENELYENNKNVGQILYKMYVKGNLDPSFSYPNMLDLSNLISKKEEMEDTNKGGLSLMVHSLISKRKLISVKEDIDDQFSLWGSQVIVKSNKIKQLSENYELYDIYNNKIKALLDAQEKVKKDRIILESNYPFLINEKDNSYNTIDSKKEKLLAKLDQLYIYYGRILSNQVCDISDIKLRELYQKVRNQAKEYERLKKSKKDFEFLEKKDEASLVLSRKQAHLKYLFDNKKEIEKEIEKLEQEIKSLKSSYFSTDYSD